MKARKQSSTSYPINFLLVSSTDHIAAVTGATPTVTISKNGGAFAAPSGAVTEIGNGWYQIAGNATDRNTLGEFIVHATAASADPVDDRYVIVAFDPFDSNMGAPNLDAAVSSRLPTASYIAPDNATIATIQADTNDIQTRLPAALVGGRMDASVGAMAADVLTAAALAADAIAEIQAGLATVAGQATIAGYIDTEVAVILAACAAIQAKTDNLPAAPAATSDIPTASQNASATLAAAQATPIHSRVKIINDTLLDGAGTLADPMRPA